MKLIDMSDYNRAAKTYWMVMVSAGAVVCAWAIRNCTSFTATQATQLAALLLLVAFTSSYPIRIPGTKSSFTAGDVFTFISCLLLGIPAAVLIGVVDALVSSRRTSKRLVSWIGGPAMMAVTVAASSNVFYFFVKHYAEISNRPLGLTPVRIDHLLAGMGLLALTHSFLNGLTISTIYALKSRRPIFKFWRDSYFWTWWSFLASAIGATIIYVAASRIGWFYALVSV